MHLVLNVLLVILVIAVIALAVLYFLGRKLEKRQVEQQQLLEMSKQTVSMLVIDSSGCTPDWTMSVQSAATTFRPSVFAGAFIFPLSTFCCACCQLLFRFFSRRLPALCCLPCLSALHIKRKS